MPDPSDTDPAPLTGTVSGRWVVVGMFLFGIAATGTLWVYWQWHTAPFRPLQEAIAARYEDSAPRVDGGRRKGRSDEPFVLRVIMRVPFDPTEDKEQAQRRTREVGELARNVLDLSTIDRLELRLFQLRPEDEIRKETFVIPITELRGSSTPATD